MQEKKSNIKFPWFFKYNLHTEFAYNQLKIDYQKFESHFLYEGKFKHSSSG